MWHKFCHSGTNTPDSYYEFCYLKWTPGCYFGCSDVSSTTTSTKHTVSERLAFTGWKIIKWSVASCVAQESEKSIMLVITEFLGQGHLLWADCWGPYPDILWMNVICSFHLHFCSLYIKYHGWRTASIFSLKLYVFMYMSTCFFSKWCRWK